MKTLQIFYHKLPQLDSLSKEQQLRFFEMIFGNSRTAAIESATLALFSIFEIKQRKLYQIGGYSEFKKYLKAVHGISSSTYYDNIPIVEMFHKQLTHENGDFPDLSRLRKGRKVIDMIKDPSKVEEVYSMAQTCDDEGFANNMRELQGKIATDNCPNNHSKTREKIYLVCLDCGKNLGLREKQDD